MHCPIGTILITCLLAAPPLLAAGPNGSSTDPVKTKAKTDGRAQTIAEAWKRLSDVSGHGCGNDLVHDYGRHGGMRNFFCRTLTVFSWDHFLTLAPVSPFKSGPHGKTGLDLQSQSTFGHYDPAFVRWAIDTLVPASTDTSLRKATQGIYNHQVRTLARVHFKVWQAINHDPKWRTTEAALYQASIAKGYEDHMMHIDHYHDTLGHAASNWGDNDPNTVRTATMWWVRRSIDGTADLWSEGLLRLLKAYDGAWLDSKLASPTGPAPAREPGPTPEYRKGSHAH